jgi:DNA-binding transcriptional MerR regulator
MKNKNNKMLKVGELIKETGLRSSTIKYYTELGLLPYEQKEERLARQYPLEENTKRIKEILKLKKQGKTIEEIIKIIKK